MITCKFETIKGKQYVELVTHENALRQLQNAKDEIERLKKRNINLEKAVAEAQAHIDCLKAELQ